MLWVAIFGVVFALIVVVLIRGAVKAGPRQVDVSIISGGQKLLSVTAAEPGDGWQKLGRLTSANGLNLKFEHNDDPAAEATLLAPGVDPNEKSYSRL